jgi:hypothetical protein
MRVHAFGSGGQGRCRAEGPLEAWLGGQPKGITGEHRGGEDDKRGVLMC